MNLSEATMNEIKSNEQFNKMLDIQKTIISKLNNAIQAGNSKESLKNLMITSCNSNNYTELNNVVFGSNENATLLFTEYQTSMNSLVEAYPQLASNNCGRTKEENINIINNFFNNYDNFYTFVMNSGGNGEQDVAGCSYWKAGLCAAACGVSTSGWGAAWCLYGCGCMFCPSGMGGACGPEINPYINSNSSN